MWLRIFRVSGPRGHLSETGQNPQNTFQTRECPTMSLHGLERYHTVCASIKEKPRQNRSHICRSYQEDLFMLTWKLVLCYHFHIPNPFTEQAHNTRQLLSIIGDDVIVKNFWSKCSYRLRPAGGSRPLHSGGCWLQRQPLRNQQYQGFGLLVSQSCPYQNKSGLTHFLNLPSTVGIYSFNLHFFS